MTIQSISFPKISHVDIGNAAGHFSEDAFSSFKLEQTNSYKLTDHFQKIKHLKAVQLPKLYLTFDSQDSIQSFNCDYELNETESELVKFEADLYWVTKGGTDPMDSINKFPGRFSLFHVKDVDEDLEQTTVGTGIIDFKAILNSRERAGLEYYFVEDERTDDPFGNLKADFDYLNTSDSG